MISDAKGVRSSSTRDCFMGDSISCIFLSAGIYRTRCFLFMSYVELQEMNRIPVGEIF